MISFATKTQKIIDWVCISYIRFSHHFNLITIKEQNIDLTYPSCFILRCFSHKQTHNYTDRQTNKRRKESLSYRLWRHFFQKYIYANSSVELRKNYLNLQIVVFTLEINVLSVRYLHCEDLPSYSYWSKSKLAKKLKDEAFRECRHLHVCDL